LENDELEVSAQILETFEAMNELSVYPLMKHTSLRKGSFLAFVCDLFRTNTSLLNRVT